MILISFILFLLLDIEDINDALEFSNSANGRFLATLILLTAAEPGLFGSTRLASLDFDVGKYRFGEDFLVMLKLIFKEPAIVLVRLIVDLLHQADCEFHFFSIWFGSLLLNDRLIPRFLGFCFDLFGKLGILSGNFGV